jgi:hypothetical protein
MILGIMGFILCWLPVAGIFFNGLGLFLGFVGVIASSSKHWKGIGFAAAGLGISVFGLSVSLVALIIYHHRV